MHLGAVFPQTEIGADPVAIRDFAQAVEDLGYHHLLAYDHVILPAAGGYVSTGAGSATNAVPIHEPLVLFGYLAGLTRLLELVTGVLILPQRQTVLVAKQAAEVDVLSGGRLRLGVGIGWIPEEYAALGVDYHDRGRRSTEQISILRSLWTESAVTFTGRGEDIASMGINPLPVQRPIPLWIGGMAEAALQRAGQVADGWFPLGIPPDETARGMIERLHGYAVEAGRDGAAIGVEAFLTLGDLPAEHWAVQAAAWEAIGATHLAVSTIGLGFTGVEQHIEALQQARTVITG